MILMVSCVCAITMYTHFRLYHCSLKHRCNIIFRGSAIVKIVLEKKINHPKNEYVFVAWLAWELGGKYGVYRFRLARLQYD